MHAGATAIRFSASLITIATHGRAGPIPAERAGTIGVGGLMPNAAVTPDQAVIPVAAAIGLTGTVGVIPVIGKGVVSVAVVVVSVAVVVMVVAVADSQRGVYPLDGEGWVALLDIEMPKLDGLGVVREMVKSGLKTEVIFLTFHANQDLFRSAMELGCKGYILKDSAVQEVVASIHAVASGLPYISSAITTDLLHRQNQADAKSNQMSRLTPTEHRIMRLIARGKTSKEIGAELSIHYRTVENHRTSMCRKLDLEGEGANALLRFALQNKDVL